MSADIWNDEAKVEYRVFKNPDSTFIKALKKRLKANNGFCPNQMERSPDTKCPCKEFRESQECRCGMYIKIPFYEEDESWL